MKRRAGALALGIVACLLLTGCISAAAAAPACDSADRTLRLMTQSVPSATKLPCVEEMPDGWSLTDVEVTDAGTRLHFGAEGQEGPVPFLVVRLLSRCELADAVEVPADEPGTRQYEDITDLTGGYAGTRYYVFDGACVTYEFSLDGEGWSAVVHDASTALSFADRSDLEGDLDARAEGSSGR